MENRGAVSGAFVKKAADIDERLPGYQRELVSTIVAILKDRDNHGTDQSRRAAIEQLIKPLALRLSDSGKENS